MNTPAAPLSPLTAWRHEHNYSLGEFAKASGCTRVAVQRKESGCYTAVHDGIMTALLSRPTVLTDGTSLLSTDEIAQAYETFQTRTRRLTYLSQLLKPYLPPLPPYHSTSHLNQPLPIKPLSIKPPVGVPSPIVHWRLDSGVASQLQFCKLLCLHPHTVNQAESGAQRKLPRQMLAALAQAGYDDGLIEELSKRQADYYDSK